MPPSPASRCTCPVGIQFATSHRRVGALVTLRDGQPRWGGRVFSLTLGRTIGSRAAGFAPGRRARRASPFRAVRPCEPLTCWARLPASSRWPSRWPASLGSAGFFWVCVRRRRQNVLMPLAKLLSNEASLFRVNNHSPDRHSEMPDRPVLPSIPVRIDVPWTTLKSEAIVGSLEGTFASLLPALSSILPLVNRMSLELCRAAVWHPVISVTRENGQRRSAA